MVGEEKKNKDMEFLKGCGKKVIEPFHELWDDSKVPFGKYNKSGVFHIDYTDTMDGEDGGYEVFPIYGVAYDDRQYRIFIGEAPHKDENGEWVTYNEVPNFIVGAFGGAHYIRKNVDKPHFIRMTVEEFDMSERNRNYNENKELGYYKRLYDNPKIGYCFKNLFKSIGREIRHWRKRHLFFVKGEHMYFMGLRCFGIQFDFGKEYDKSETFFDMLTKKWVRRLWVRKNYKRGISYMKWENDNCCYSC